MLLTRTGYAVLALGLLTGPSTAETIWHVDSSAPGPGSGTPEDPFASIQYAISRESTVDGDRLLVAPGVYLETIDYLGKTLHVSSSSGPALTVIDGNGAGSVVTVASGEGIGTVLEGFTITGGSGKQIGGTLHGGGIYCVDSNPSVVGCWILDNDMVYFGGGLPKGGGVYAERAALVLAASRIEGHDNGEGVFAASSVITVDGCTIRDNRNFGGLVIPTRASGLTLVDCTTVIEESSIRNNGNDVFVIDQGGGVLVSGGTLDLVDCDVSENLNEGRGGGLMLADCVTTITRCNFVGNRSTDYFYGGAIYVPIDAPSSLVVVDSTFVGNRAGDGGGAYIESGSACFERCLFLGNDVLSRYYELGSGAAVFAAEGSLVTLSYCVLSANRSQGNIRFGFSGNGAVYGPACLSSCTVVDNVAEGHTTLPVGGAWGSRLVDCIVWGNYPRNLGGSASADYCDVEGGWPGTGNLDADPRFRDPGARDYRLLPSSPCIDAGDPASGADPDGSRKDLGAFPFHRHLARTGAVGALRHR